MFLIRDFQQSLILLFLIVKISSIHDYLDIELPTEIKR
jgi:hypothetical protein